MTTASGSTKSSRMMVSMWCVCYARAFPLMAVYGCGMLPKNAAMAFSVVLYDKWDKWDCRNPYWNPLLEPLSAPEPYAGTLVGTPFGAGTPY